MRKLFTAIILTVTMALPAGIVGVEAQQISVPPIGQWDKDFTWRVNRDTVVEKGWRTQQKACDLREGTYIYVSASQPGVYRAVRSYSQGYCRGYIPYDHADKVEPEGRVITTGNWKHRRGVPVYKTQREYFNARDHGIIGTPACYLRKFTNLDISRPYRDWGLTEITESFWNPRTCKGWTDRGVIEQLK